LGYNNDMQRRRFITVAGIGMLVSTKRLLAEHHVVSADPLMVDFDLRSLEGAYTSVEDFYVRNHGDVPRSPGTPSLRIEGEVEKPLTLTPRDLESLPKQEMGAVLECAGDLVGAVAKVSNGLWQGWSLSDALGLAQPKRRDGYLNLFGRDGYARSVPLGRAFGGGMLVTHLNRRPLDSKHGTPWRALFPGWYGMDSVKWLDRVVVATTPLATNEDAYMEVATTPSGAVERKPLPRMLVKSVITHPADGSVLSRGTTEVRGLAWSGAGGISVVEVSGDAGATWRTTSLDRASRYEWTLWRSPWEFTQRGPAEFVCKATDETGATQPQQRDPKRLDGYTNNWLHRVRCVVV